MQFCCEDMRRQVERVCDIHTDRWDCPDCLVSYWPQFGEYGLMIHDGGTSSVLIRFCPWCGAKLPDSTRSEMT
jgi:ribosomal protein S27AE